MDMVRTQPAGGPGAKSVEPTNDRDGWWWRGRTCGTLTRMDAIFTYETAAALLPEARRRVAEVAEGSRQLQQLATAIRAGETATGDMARAKALEARLDEQLGWFRDRGVQVKGVAPALLDFPARAVVAGQQQVVLLCWREGEEALAWYHPPESGYLGRAPIAELEEV